MTLKDVIDNNYGKVLKIGMSSSFIFCDTITDDIYERMYKLNERMRFLATIGYNSRKRTLSKLYEELKRTSNVDRTLVKIQETEKYVNYMKKEFEEGYCLLARKVLAMYPSKVEDNCYIVLIEGPETGNYWTVSEYRNSKHFI